MRGWLSWFEERFNVTEMFSFLTNFGLFPAEIDTRKPVVDAVTEALERPLPSYVRWPRVLGVLSLLTFFLLAVTGLMLAFYYQPTTSEAYSSVTVLVRDVTVGWLVHELHRWGALLFVLLLLVRAWRFYFQGLYKAPREALWVLAVLSFLAAAAMDFTGRLLTWEQGGYWGVVRGLEILHALPLGGPILSFLAGGREITALALVRSYVLHLVILPCMMLVLFYLSFAGVRRVGLTPLAARERTVSGGFRANLYSLIILALLILGALATMSVLFPSRLDAQADPFVTPPGVRPPWYLLASYGFLELFPAAIPRFFSGLLLEVLLLAILVLPFLDRTTGRTVAERRLAIALGFVALLVWVLLSVHGYRLEVSR